MSYDTGFDLHVGIPVARQGDQPSPHTQRVARDNIAGKAKYEGKAVGKLYRRWFDVSGLGYDKDWMWVLGGNYRKSKQENTNHA